MGFNRGQLPLSGGRSLPSKSGWHKVSTVLLLLGLCALGSVMVHAQTAAEATPPPCPAPDTNGSSLITEYAIPTADSGPRGIAAGPDGALWFGPTNGKNIGRITTDGKFTEYPFPLAHEGDQRFLVSGPDGAVWFNDDWQNQIGRISMDGQITEYPIPSGIPDTDDNGAAYITSLPRGLVTGADGALWFTEGYGNNIGRITVKGEVTEYPIPTADSFPIGVALGWNGAVWFVERNGNQIGRITTDGEITEYPVPTPDSFLLRIAAGSDGALWFTEFNGNKIGRITLDGKITEYALPPCANPTGITAGPDQAIWFTEYTANKIGRISMDGQITEYVVPTPDSVPYNIVTGSDGALWFTENAGGKIGRLQVPVALPTPAARTQTQTTTLPSAGKIIATIPIGASPMSVAIGEEAVWVTTSLGDVLRIDPATNQVVATIHVGGGPYDYIAFGEGAVWVTLWYNDMVVRIDPQSNKVVANIPVGHAPAAVAVSPGAVWVSNHHDDSVSRIDRATNTVTNTITDVGSGGTRGADYLVTGAGAVWVDVPDSDAMMRIDPATNAVVAKFPGSFGGAVVANSESVWYGTSSGLSRIDPLTNQIVATVQIPLVQYTTNLALGLGSLWAVMPDDLLRIDPQTNQVVGELALSTGGNNGGNFDAVGYGSIWVCIEASGSLLRIEPAA